jgi:regulator of protease activity HflC (stomatin/prohibitin superfamily)
LSPRRPLKRKTPDKERIVQNSFVGLIIAGLIILLILVIIARTIRVIQQGLVGVVKRLGQFHSVRNPGVTFLVPFIDNMETVDMRETPRTGDRQDVITKDNVSVVVNATIFSQVVDPRMALFSVSNYLLAVDQISRTTLRAIFGEMSLDEALSQREQINTRLQNQMESVTDKWGVRINRVEILDIVPPQNILQAMALQKQADQEKRAAILQSEGQQASQINVAEGQKQAQIKQAEGQKQSAILYAEGQRQAQILEAEGRSQAIAAVYSAIKTGAPTPELLAVLQLDTLGKFASSPNSKVLVPYEAAGLLGAVQALRSTLDGVPEAKNSSRPG